MDRRKITTYRSAEELMPELQKGDLIEFLNPEIEKDLREFRLSPDDSETEVTGPGMNEWCVYIGVIDGDGSCVLHADPIVVSPLNKAAGGRLCRLNNGFDWINPALEEDSIVERALTAQERSEDAFVFENSEQFAVYCRNTVIFPTVMWNRATIGIIRVVHYDFDGNVDKVRGDKPNVFVNGKKEEVTPFLRGESAWVTVEELLQNGLCIGDMIEFKSTAAYNHWGVYVGRMFGGMPMIVHKTQNPGDGAKSSGAPNLFKSIVSHTTSKIDRSPLVGDGLCRVNNIHDIFQTALPPMEIVRNALEAVTRCETEGANSEYNLVGNNCEHFASLCRYGRKSCTQVSDASNAAVVGAVVGSTILTLGAPILSLTLGASTVIGMLIAGRKVYTGQFLPLIHKLAVSAYRVKRRLRKLFTGKEPFEE